MNPIASGPISSLAVVLFSVYGKRVSAGAVCGGSGGRDGPR